MSENYQLHERTIEGQRQQLHKLFLESKLEEKKWSKNENGATATKPFYVNTSKIDNTSQSGKKSIRNAEVDLFNKEVMGIKIQDSIMVNESSLQALPYQESSTLDQRGQAVKINDFIKQTKAVTIEDHAASTFTRERKASIGAADQEHFSLEKFPEHNVSECKFNGGYISGPNQPNIISQIEQNDSKSPTSKVYFKTMEGKQVFAA